RREVTGEKARPREGASDHRQLDVDVSLGRPGVGAAAVGLGDQVLDLVAGQVGDGDPQLDGQPVPALGVLGQADQGGDGRPGRVEVDLVDPGHAGQGVVEAGGVAGGEQLLGIGALAGAADLLGRVDLDVDGAVGGVGVAVLAAAGGGGFGGVEHVHGVLLVRGSGPLAHHAGGWRPLPFGGPGGGRGSPATTSSATSLT